MIGMLGQNKGYCEMGGVKGAVARHADHVKGIAPDQRGVKRPDGPEHFCHIGAYEYVDEPA